MKNYLLSLLLFFFTSTLVAQNPFIKNYTIANGIPSNKITCAYQDSQGFMWFGTDAGVIRFDGKNFTNFTLEDGLSDNIIMRIKEDKEGRLWFFNLNGTMNFYFQKKIYNSENAPFLDELKTDFYLIDFFQDSDSTLYFYNSISEVMGIKHNSLVDFKNFEFSTKDDLGLFLLNKSTDNNFSLWTALGNYSISNFEDSLKLRPSSVRLQRAFSDGKNKIIGLDHTGYIHFYRNSEKTKQEKIKSESQLVNSIVTDNDGLLLFSALQHPKNFH